MPPRPALLLPVLILLLANACAPETSSDLVEVSGVVTLDGKPLPDARVTFHDAGPLAPSGLTDAQGRYTLTTYSDDDGARPGSYAVSIRTGPDARIPGKKNAPDTLKGKYADHAASGLAFQVPPEGSASADFPLQSAN